jgi:hypothetical protein
MANWIIFLLHFCAAIFYIVAGHIERGNALLFILLVIAGIFLTTTAAWI